MADQLWPHCATAVLHNGLGHYDAALAAAQRACEHDDLGLFGWALVELVEAAPASASPEARRRGAGAACASGLSAGGTDWALGIEARSRALLSDGEAADALYREAIERLGRTRMPRRPRPRPPAVRRMAAPREPPRGRARTAARGPRDVQPRSAPTASPSAPAASWLATGETVRKRTVETRDELTAQEAQIARLAAGRADEPGDRRPAVHQPAHGRVAPAQGVHQARHQLPQRPPLTRRPIRRATSGQQPTPAAETGSRKRSQAPPAPVPRVQARDRTRVFPGDDARRSA